MTFNLTRSVFISAVLLAVIGCAAKPKEPQIAIEDFCSDPRIIVESQKQDPELLGSAPWCEAYRIGFRRDNEVVDVAVASVLRGSASSGDVLYPVMESFVRLPEGRLVSLGRVPPVPVHEALAQRALVEDLGFGGSERDTAALHRFYTPVLELTKRGYCVTLEMHPPFSGSVTRCAGDREFVGDVTYVPGAITWTQARGEACDINGRYRPCKLVDQRLLSDAANRGIYFIEVEHTLDPYMSPKYERLYFSRDVATGKGTLLGRRLPNEPPLQPKDLLKLP